MDSLTQENVGCADGHEVIDGLHGSLIKHAAGDAGLIGDDDEAVSQGADLIRGQYPVDGSAGTETRLLR